MSAHLALSAFGEGDSDDGQRPAYAAHPSGTLLRNSAKPRAAAAWHGVVAAADVDALAADAEAVVGDTYWLEPQDVPRCALERFALDVLHAHAKDVDRPVVGVEWWVQCRSSDGQPTIRLHWDSDEQYTRRTGEHLPPWLATVTYLTSCGAPTVVFPVGADAHGRAVRAGTTAYVSPRAWQTPRLRPGLHGARSRRRPPRHRGGAFRCSSTCGWDTGRRTRRAFRRGGGATRHLRRAGRR